MNIRSKGQMSRLWGHKVYNVVTKQPRETISGRPSYFIKTTHDTRHNTSHSDGRPLTASAFNRLGHCYAELAVSTLAVVKTIASMYCAYPRRYDQAEYRRGWLLVHTKTV